MRKRGFTIIEVVLVLAIAGLIFLMVFIALPALQRSQRNTRRRQDISRISTAFTQYMSQNSKLPFYGTLMSMMGDEKKKAVGNFVSHYIEEDAELDASGSISGHFVFACKAGSDCPEFSDPDGSIYSFQYTTTPVTVKNQASNSENFKDHKIFVVTSAKCSGNDSDPVESTSGANSFALAYMLEGGSIYCVDNS